MKTREDRAIFQLRVANKRDEQEKVQVADALNSETFIEISTKKAIAMNRNLPCDVAATSIYWFSRVQYCTSGFFSRMFLSSNDGLAALASSFPVCQGVLSDILFCSCVVGPLQLPHVVVKKVQLSSTIPGDLEGCVSAQLIWEGHIEQLKIT